MRQRFSHFSAFLDRVAVGWPYCQHPSRFSHSFPSCYLRVTPYHNILGASSWRALHLVTVDFQVPQGIGHSLRHRGAYSGDVLLEGGWCESTLKVSVVYGPRYQRSPAPFRRTHTKRGNLTHFHSLIHNCPGCRDRRAGKQMAGRVTSTVQWNSQGEPVFSE